MKPIQLELKLNRFLNNFQLCREVSIPREAARFLGTAHVCPITQNNETYFSINVGKFTNHKGRNRRFTNPEELEEQRRKEEQERKWRKDRGESSESEDEEESGPSSTKKKQDSSGSDSETDETSSEEEVRTNNFLYFFL